MKYSIPEVGEIELKTILLDLNGTLAVNGQIVVGVKERIQKLKAIGYKIFLLTGNQRGNAGEICDELGIDFKVAKSSAEKEKVVLENFEPQHVVAIGNARIDIGMFKHARVSIATLQSEGVHVGILSEVDILIPSICDALDLLLDVNSLAATMRK